MPMTILYFIFCFLTWAIPSPDSRKVQEVQEYGSLHAHIHMYLNYVFSIRIDCVHSDSVLKELIFLSAFFKSIEYLNVIDNLESTS